MGGRLIEIFESIVLGGVGVGDHLLERYGWK
jgi:hypothetical protein